MRCPSIGMAAHGPWRVERGGRTLWAVVGRGMIRAVEVHTVEWRTHAPLSPMYPWRSNQGARRGTEVSSERASLEPVHQGPLGDAGPPTAKYIWSRARGLPCLEVAAGQWGKSQDLTMYKGGGHITRDIESHGTGSWSRRRMPRAARALDGDRGGLPALPRIPLAGLPGPAHLTPRSPPQPEPGDSVFANPESRGLNRPRLDSDPWLEARGLGSPWGDA